jgi:hypothetical protein
MIKKILHHFFVPHTKNNHRAKLLHHSSLFAVCVLLLALSFSFSYIHKKTPSILGISYSITEPDLVAATNRIRVEKGLRPLTINPQLSDAARRKAVDMFSKNYWAHFAPDGSTSPWFFIKEAGYSYLYAGENLAKGFTDSEEVVNAWMNSDSHRENMLSDKYNDIGFAIVEGRLEGEETVLVVEMFGTASPVVAPQDQAQVAADSNSVPLEVPQAQPESFQPDTVAIVPPSSERTVKAEENGGVIEKPAIDAQLTSRAITLALLVFFLAALVIDMAVVEQKKIPRIVGHNLDHIMLIVFFILFVIVIKTGAIL